MQGLHIACCLDRFFRCQRPGAGEYGDAETLPLNVHWIMGMDIQLIGSCWFTTGDGQELAGMARVGTLDLSVMQHRCVSLKDVNGALSSLQDANRGFNNFVVIP